MMVSTTHRDNWSEHQTTMFSSLHEKQKQGKYCDVVLKCIDSDQTFNAHSCVLSSASSVLDKLLQDSMDGKLQVTSPEGSIGKIFVLLPKDVVSSCMDSLLNYIYSGNVDLFQTKSPQKGKIISSVRKSKRISSSKIKHVEASSTAVDDTSIDSSLLHAFLKASRCLEIKTLTEHLESAVTLTEMKMTEVQSPERPQRSSASKFDSSKSSSSSSDNTPAVLGGTKKSKSKSNKKSQEIRPLASSSRNHKAKKKKHLSLENDESNDLMLNIEKSGTKLSDRKFKKDLEENEETFDEQVEHSTIADNSSSEFFCNKCQETFKSRSALKRHLSQHTSDEQVQQVDSFPMRAQNTEQMSCSVCNKKFTSIYVMKLHMKKHETEEKRGAQVAEETVSNKQSTKQLHQADKNQTTTSSKVLSPTRPPQRASAKKFQDMMRSTFAIEINESISDIKTAKNNQKSKKKEQISSESVILYPESEQAVNMQLISSETMVGVVPEIRDDSIVSNLNLVSEEEVAMEYQILEPVTNDGIGMVGHNTENSQELNSSGVIQEYTITGTGYSNDAIGNQQEPVEERAVILEQNQDIEYDDESNDDDSEYVRTKRGMKAKRKKGKKKDSEENITPESQACDLCGKITSNAKNMMSHMRSHNREELICSYCNQKFKYRSALKRHQRWHTGEGQNCHVCNKVIHTQQEMTQHLSSHNVKKMRTQCTLCQKSFTSLYVMQLHMRTHSGDELFVCDFCGKKFPYKSSLKMHMRLHTGERPYICSVCGKCFVQKIHAKEHELQHAGIRRFQCELCMKMFAHKCGLSRHIADIHYKSRPYVCDQCGKSFPRKTKLVEHTRSHTGEKPYICGLCGARYKANRSLKEHKKKTHKLVVNDYEVGIWRNGIPPAEMKKPLPMRKKRKVKVTATFSFPVPDPDEIKNIVEDANAEEENIINNIAKEVDIISTDETEEKSPDHSTSISLTTVESQHGPQHFTYSMPVATEYQNIQYTTIIEGSNYTEKALPPASTLTKISHGTVLPTYQPAMQGQPTFVVPLNVSTNSAIPVIGEQVTIGGVSHIPSGMMVTCVLPQQMVGETTNISSVAITEGLSNTTQMSRSASVPPMSTFRRKVGPIISDPVNSESTFQTTTTPVSSLPGMHTFQPVQFHMDAAQLPQMLTAFTQMQTVPVMVPASTVISQVTEPMAEGEGGEPDIVVHEQTAEWHSTEYSSEES
ncbi:uncharacterized protein LOC120342703 isoform X1 [Styela clava]